MLNTPNFYFLDMQSTKYIYALALLSLLVSSYAWATDYTKGHEALQIFDSEGMRLAPTWVKIWVGFMALSFVSGLLFVKQHSIARWVVGGFVFGFILTSIAPLFNIVVLSGLIALIHIVCWSPGLYRLLSSRPFLTGEQKQTAFSIWCGVITLVIVFSFVFDIRDSAIYLGHIFGS